MGKPRVPDLSVPQMRKGSLYLVIIMFHVTLSTMLGRYGRGLVTDKGHSTMLHLAVMEFAREDKKGYPWAEAEGPPACRLALVLHGPPRGTHCIPG